jgi:alpha-glucosidase
MNGNEPHTFDVPLYFLEKDCRYIAHIYTDDPAVSTRTGVKISRYIVNSSFIVKAVLRPRCGQAIRIHPATADDLKTYPLYEGP